MRSFSLFFLLCVGSLGLFAQDEPSLLDEVNDEPEKEYVRAAFKANRVVNAHSLDNTAKGVFDFKVSHRFGLLSDGLYGMFGLDQASIRIGGDYGITDRLQIGAGRSTYQKSYDGYFKYKILWQRNKAMPISLLWASGVSANTLRNQHPDGSNYTFPQRLSYFNQLIIGRKFSDRFSLQLMPTWVHKNLVATNELKNDIFAMGIAGRYKFSRRLALTGEYFYVLPNQIEDKNYNSLSLGLDIETGGHVFQLQFSNSTAMIEKGFITETNSSWLDAGIHFGFNISRVFTVVRPKSAD